MNDTFMKEKPVLPLIWCAPRQEDNEINQQKISQVAFK